MIKNKIRPQNFNGGTNYNSHNFFYRLVSDQRFLAIVGLAILVIIVIPLVQTYGQQILVGKEIQGVNKQVNNYKIQSQRLQKLLAYSHSDQYLETQARLSLNMKKAGEGVIIVENPKVKVIEIKADSAVKPVSNLVKWWRYFFN